MAFGLADTIKPGSTTEMTLTFADGDKLSAQLTAQAPGGSSDNHSMAGMDKGGAH